jgi:hypothetical protein
LNPAIFQMCKIKIITISMEERQLIKGQNRRYKWRIRLNHIRLNRLSQF